MLQIIGAFYCSQSMLPTCRKNPRQMTRWRVTHLCLWGEQINTISQGQCADARRLSGLSPAVQSFNKSDISDLGKRFNGCFLCVFQHSVGGWSNATGQGRHSVVRRFKWMFLQNNKLSWIPVQESIRLGHAVYLHNGSKWFAKGKRLV